MSITVERYTSYSNPNKTATIPFDINAPSVGRKLCVIAACYSGSSATLSCTYDGEALTSADSYSDGYYFTEVFYIDNADLPGSSGTYDLYVSSSAYKTNWSVFELTNAEQGAVHDTLHNYVNDTEITSTINVPNKGLYLGVCASNAESEVDRGTEIYNSGADFIGYVSVVYEDPSEIGDVDVTWSIDVPVGHLTTRLVSFDVETPDIYSPADGATYTITGASVSAEIASSIETAVFGASYSILTPTVYSYIGIVTQSVEIDGATYIVTGGSCDSDIRTGTGGPFAATGLSLSITGGSIETKVIDTVQYSDVLTGAIFEFGSIDLETYQSEVVLPIGWVTKNANLAYPCDIQLNCTTRVLEKLDVQYDILPSSSAPTFDTGNRLYVFNGTSDALDSATWLIPDSWFASAALSDSYPDGTPYIMQGYASDLKALLTTPGSFDGTLLNMVFYDKHPSEVPKQILADFQLRSRWKETVVDPYTARLIRNEQIGYLGQYERSEDKLLYDYSSNGNTVTNNYANWNNGLLTPYSNSYLSVSDSEYVRFDTNQVTLYVSFVIGTGYLFYKDTDYWMKIFKSGNSYIYQDMFGSRQIPSNAKTIITTYEVGEPSKLYINGTFFSELNIVTPFEESSADLFIGGDGTATNYSGKIYRTGVIKKALNDNEARMFHYSALLELSKLEIT